MKQKTIFIFPLIGVLLFYFACSSPEKLIKLQETYIPSAIAGVYIGMPLNSLKEKRGMQNLSMTKKGDGIVLKEECTKDSIILVQYLFNNKKKLSKIIIEYSDNFEVYDSYKARLGEPNSNKAWLFSLEDHLKLLIWVQQHSLCIANNKQFKK